MSEETDVSENRIERPSRDEELAHGRFAPSWPKHDPEIVAAVESALRDGSWGKYDGPHSKRLTAALRDYFNVEHALTCCSGTFAVQLALRGLGVGAGDEVLLAGYDYPGNFRAIEAVGAMPVLIDVAANSATLDVSQISAACSPRTRAIVVSHLHGELVPMRQLVEVAKAHKLAIVEDACQSPGAIVDGRKAGTWGDVGVLSFGGSKLLSAGRGGAIVTSRADVHQRAKIFCYQGNHAFPLSELQALVILPQLAKLDACNAKRLANVARLVKAIDSTALRPLVSTTDGDSPVYYKLGLWFDDEDGITREAFIERAQAAGIALGAGFRGFLQRGPRRCRRVGSLDNSARAAMQMVVLHHPVLLESADTIDALAASLATRSPSGRR